MRSIGNLAHANFVARFFDIPLQDDRAGSDGYTATALSDTLANLFSYVFLDLDTAASFKNRVVAEADTKCLGQKMQKVVEGAKGLRFPSLRSVLRMDSGNRVLRSYGLELVERLLGHGKSVDEVVWTIIPTAAAASATQAQGVSK